MHQKVFIALPNGKTVSCTKVVADCPLEMGRFNVEVDLIAFNVLGFDIILGMYWLFQHYMSNAFLQ